MTISTAGQYADMKSPSVIRTVVYHGTATFISLIMTVIFGRMNVTTRKATAAATESTKTG
jgi:hypothetical protein